MARLKESPPLFNRKGREVDMSHVKSPWSDFRILCRYYADCVTTGERATETHEIEKEHQNFIVLMPSTDWLGSESFCTRFDIRRDLFFLSRLETIREYDEIIYVGYPCEVYRVSGQMRTSPVFLMPAQVEKEDARTLRIKLDYDNVKLNYSWVEYNVPKQDRITFLNSIHDRNGRVNFESILSYFINKTGLDFNPARCEVALDAKNPGLQNFAILSSGFKLKYSKTLRKELNYIASVPDEVLDATALAYVFRNPRLPNCYSEERRPSFPANFIPSNHDQQQAIIEALNCPCSRIQGPPGTGKSQAAVNLLMNLAYQGQSALFTSRNHQAIHAISEKVMQVFSGHEEARTTGFNLVQFCSNQDGSAAQTWMRADLLAMQAAVKCLAGGTISRTLIDLVDDALDDGFAAWRNLEKYQKSFRDLERISQAIEQERAGLMLPEETDVKWVKKRLAFLEKLRPSRWYLRILWWLSKKEIRQKIVEEDLRIKFPKISARTRLALCERLRRQLSYLEKYRKAAIVLQEAKDEASKLPPYQECLSEALSANNKVDKHLLDAMFAKLAERTENIPDSLIADIKKINARINVLKMPWMASVVPDVHDEASRAFCELTKFYPIWVCTLLSLTKSSPCAAGIFNRVVIDESYQCDLPSIVPALFRAKGVTLVGDPQQFPPVIDMPDIVHALLQAKYNLHDQRLAQFDYKSGTAYSSVCETPVLLREHFRCAPEIISFCSEAFYHGKLIVRTEVDNRVPSLLGYHSALDWEDIRNSQVGEIEALKSKLTDLVRIVDSLDPDFTIGVVTPFRMLANRLVEELRPFFKNLDGHLSDRHVNTSTAFQGGECDLVFMVLGLNEETSRGQEWYAESTSQAHLYNVAVSRAKHLCVIIGDRERAAASPSPVLRKLAQNRKQSAPSDVKIGPGERVLKKALEEVGIFVVEQRRLGRRWLDLAIEESKIDIEVDGVTYHTDARGNRKQDDYYRDREVCAQGWRVYRCWHHHVMDPLERKKIVQEILTWHKER